MRLFLARTHAAILVIMRQLKQHEQLHTIHPMVEKDILEHIVDINENKVGTREIGVELIDHHLYVGIER